MFTAMWITGGSWHSFSLYGCAGLSCSMQVMSLLEINEEREKKKTCCFWSDASWHHLSAPWGSFLRAHNSLVTHGWITEHQRNTTSDPPMGHGTQESRHQKCCHSERVKDISVPFLHQRDLQWKHAFTTLWLLDTSSSIEAYVSASISTVCNTL